MGFKYCRSFERKDYFSKYKVLINNNFCLVLVEFQGKKKKMPPCYKNPIKNFKTLGLKHFALRIKNLQKLKKKLDKFKYIFLDEKNSGKNAKIQIGISRIKYIFLKDPNGNLIELVEDINEK